MSESQQIQQMINSTKASEKKQCNISNKVSMFKGLKKQKYMKGLDFMKNELADLKENQMKLL